MKPKAKAAPKTIDDYLAPLDPDKRASLEKLRKTISAAAPKAEECISYGIPGFRLDGKPFVWFGAAANHCSFYPGGIVADFRDELREFEVSKGTVRFQPEHPLPAGLVRKIVKARIAKSAARRRG